MQRQKISFGASEASRGSPSASCKYGSSASRAAPPAAPCEPPERSSVPTRAQKANGLSKAGTGPALCAAPCSPQAAPKTTSAKQRRRVMVSLGSHSIPIAEFYSKHPRPDHCLRFNCLGIADKDLAARVGDILAVELRCPCILADAKRCVVCRIAGLIERLAGGTGGRYRRCVADYRQRVRRVRPSSLCESEVTGDVPLV